MSESAQQAIDEVRRRLREIETQLADSAVLSDPSAMGRLGKRHARLRHVVSVADRVDQLRADVEAAEDLTEEDPAFGLEAERLRGQLDLASTELTELLARLRDEKRAHDQAMDPAEWNLLDAEKRELEDLQILSANIDAVKTRRDLLAADAAYASALVEVQPRGVTVLANRLVDTYLTSAVEERFEEERNHFDISHLNVGLNRKSGQTQAEFKVDTQTQLTKLTSQILSEGEQRALALASFLTEVALTDGAGPIVIDDPVSSLDRERSRKVAGRLAEEARQRQVVVFTHDLVFFNELCREAEGQGIEPETVALFGDRSSTGKTDAAGIIWKGATVKRRIGRLKNDMARLPKLQATSPSDYEVEMKNLYGRLRDCYERVVEQHIFQDVVSRGSDAVRTQLLRKVSLSDEHALRFHEGMTKANTYSHDNPAAETVANPTPEEFEKEVAFLENLVSDLEQAAKETENGRPEMKIRT